MSSESEQRYAMMDEKKRKRMISNRESARRSRMRKQKQMQDLTDEMSRLELSNASALSKIDEITDKYTTFASENNVLRAQMMELSERLRSLDDMVKKLEVNANGGDRGLKPWQFSCSMTHSIPASSPLLRF